MRAARRRSSFGSSIRTIRDALGMSQRELGRRVSRSQPYVSAVENGRTPGLRLSDAEKLCEAVGATLVFGVDAPLLLGAARQHDLVHARCLAHVCRRLKSGDWLTEREVEIGEPRRPGWIDILAFHPSNATLLVIEVKTAITDLGELERQIGWYEREAVSAGRRLGWRARSIGAAVLLLSTVANDDVLRRNRAAFGAAFPGRARDLQLLLEGAGVPVPRRTVAMIAPQSKARRWCRRSVLEGRRSPAAYLHYADAARAMAPTACRLARRDQRQ
jgi:transcriptional regulator with XRE-family HTH domain